MTFSRVTFTKVHVALAPPKKFKKMCLQNQQHCLKKIVGK